jgi:hypothetical protein
MAMNLGACKEGRPSGSPYLFCPVRDLCGLCFMRSGMVGDISVK